MTKVYANGRTVLHKGDGLTQASGPPDVCKTPSPSGPMPVAYPNAAMDSDIAKGTKQVRIEGNPVCVADSNIRTSTGDEAGTAGGGLMSSKTKGKLTFGSSSLDVSVEGKGVVRFGDVTQHNGNTFNTVLAAAGQSGVAYGDDPIDQVDCSICGEAKSKHKIEPVDDIVEKANQLRAALKKGPFAKAFVRGGPTNPNRPLKPGVMIGVLSCQCDAVKQYAGLAGLRYQDGNYLASGNAFIAEAGQLGLIPVVTPPSPPPLSGFHPPGAGGGGFGALAGPQWEKTLGRVERVAKRSRGNALLACAAPKLIQKCLEQGHKPGMLIEMWVAFENRTVTVSPVLTIVLDNSVSPPGRRTEWVDHITFGDGGHIPSCTTCQVTCTDMLCNTGKPPCP